MCHKPKLPTNQPTNLVLLCINFIHYFSQIKTKIFFEYFNAFLKSIYIVKYIVLLCSLCFENMIKMCLRTVVPVLSDQQELADNSSVRTQNVVWKTSRKWWMIGTDRERERERERVREIRTMSVIWQWWWRFSDRYIFSQIIYANFTVFVLILKHVKNGITSPFLETINDVGWSMTVFYSGQSWHPLSDCCNFIFSQYTR